jgi:hypothetical protein
VYHLLVFHLRPASQSTIMGVTLWSEGLETREIKNRIVLFVHKMLVGHPVVTAESDLSAVNNISCVTPCS